MASLTGRRTVVAEGSDGLGLSVARALAVDGADIAICGRTTSRLTNTMAELEGLGPGRVRGDRIDVTDEAAGAAWVEDVAATYGGLEIVVPNAGGPKPESATGACLEDYRAALELNLLSAINLVQCAVPHLLVAGGGDAASSSAPSRPGVPDPTAP